LGTVNFKNVGQGDSIIIEWDDQGANKIGVIDCNLYDNKNPVVDYLTTKSIREIDFIVLSHFHYDHFSGMPELFKFCIDKNIKIKRFFHTLAEQVLQIYNKISTSKKVENASVDFFHYFELLSKNVDVDISVNFHTTPIKLSETILLSFLGPSEKTAKNIATQINRKVNTKEFSYDDINKFSTIIHIQNNDVGVLLTADSVKACYRNLLKYLDKEIILVQAPHHGSFSNIYPNFWNSLPKRENCPAVFSVGYEPKDKLPNKETVEFIDSLGFEVHSTNPSYGISEHFGQNQSMLNKTSMNRSQYLNHFSKKVNTTVGTTFNELKYEGDQIFSF
jgi:beta-lactamase superfamily II metal-dependent hydrolase